MASGWLQGQWGNGLALCPQKQDNEVRFAMNEAQADPSESLMKLTSIWGVGQTGEFSGQKGDEDRYTCTPPLYDSDTNIESTVGNHISPYMEKKMCKIPVDKQTQRR